MGEPLFVIGKPKPKKAGSENKSNMPAPKSSSEDVEELNRRMRLLEERISSQDGRLDVLEENSIQRHKKLNSELKTLLLDINDMKRNIDELKDRILTVIKQLSLLARKEDLDVLKKYLDLWKPIKFVTHDEVQDIIREIIESYRRPKQKV